MTAKVVVGSIHRNLYNRVLASVRAGNFSIRKLKSTITFDGKGIFTIGKKLLVDKNLEWALQRGGQGPGKAPNIREVVS